MKQVAIITWPRPHATQDEIKGIITADGYIVAEQYVGNPDVNWNPLRKDLIVFIAETNNPLRIKDIVGELKKNCCFEVKGIEQQNEITAILNAFRKKRRKK
ncbi:MAG: hypothetical protein WCO66_00725 [Candidatus Absconditabacteria bacterium]